MHHHPGEGLLFDEIRKQRPGEQTDGGNHDIEMVLCTVRAPQAPPLRILIPAGGTDFSAQLQMRPQTVVVGAALKVRQDLGLRSP